MKPRGDCEIGPYCRECPAGARCHDMGDKVNILKALRRPSTAEVIDQISKSYAGVIRVALSGDPNPKCHKTMMYPTHNGGWDEIRCPLRKGHDGLMHADINYVPFFTDEDAEWFNEQYNVATSK